VADLAPARLLSQARRGSGAAVGNLLDLYRGYLKLLARVQLRHQHRGGDPSDVVQEVFLRAHKAFSQFRGTTEAELTAWLRQILARCLADWHRAGERKGRHRAASAIGAELDRSTHDWAARLVSPRESPSRSAERREAAVLLAQALERLPADYREAIVLRQLEELSSEEVARRMGRSVDSVRKLWARGMVELRQILKELL
jgi:RNA polymerase sigma-70 factor, ECF subfamily